MALYIHDTMIVLLNTLKALHDPDVGIQEPVHAVIQTCFFLRAQVSRVHRSGTLLETDIGELVNGHLDLLLRVFRLQKCHDLFLGAFIETCEFVLSN